MPGNKAAEKERKPRDRGTPVKVTFEREFGVMEILILGLILFTTFIGIFVIFYQESLAKAVVTQDGQSIEYVPVNTENDIGIGFTDGKAIITLLNMNMAQEYEYFDGSQFTSHNAQGGAAFMFVAIDAWNSGREVYEFRAGEFKVRDSRNFEYPPIEYRKPADTLKSRFLEQGISEKGILMFEVPSDAGGLSLAYKGLLWRLN